MVAERYCAARLANRSALPVWSSFIKRVVALLLPAAAAGGMLIAGCDILTAPPIVEQRWALVAAETTLGVEDLLPAGAISLGVEDSVPAGGSRLPAPGRAAQESSAVSCAPPAAAGEVVSGRGLHYRQRRADLRRLDPGGAVSRVQRRPATGARHRAAAELDAAGGSGVGADLRRPGHADARP